MPNKQLKPINVKSHHTAQTSEKCIVCQGLHTIFKCEQFKDLIPQDRHAVARKHDLFKNCLGKGRTLKNCTSQFDCFKCHKRHHTLLHRDSYSNVPSNANQVSQHSSAQSGGLQVVQQSLFSRTKFLSASTGLLATARVWALAPNGRAIRVRALFDRGSTCSFFSRSLALALGVKLSATNTVLLGIGESTVGTFSRSAEFSISANLEGEPFFNINALVIPTITTYIPNMQ